MINWQLSNWVAADHYHLTVSRTQVLTHRGPVFFEVIHWQVTSVQMVADSSFIVLKFIWNKLCLCAALFKFWFQTDFRGENSASSYRQWKQFHLTFLTMVTRWSRSTSNFYALIVQNLTGEFVQKTYAASWNLFTLIAEADTVLCQLLMFLTVFFHWIYKYNCYQESYVIHGGLFIRFLVEKCAACQGRKPYFWWHRFRFSLCLMLKRVEKYQAILALLDSF